MAGEVQEPRNGIWYDWDLGDSTWKTKNDANLKKLGILLSMAVENQTTTAPPGSPADGDAYIIGSVATGAWTGKEGDIAVYVDDDSDWYYIGSGGSADLIIGMLAYDKNLAALYVWNGTAWAAV